MAKKSAKELIVETMTEKSVMKQQVYQATHQVFDHLKEHLQKIAKELEEEVAKKDDRIVIEYRSKGDFEAELKFAGDILVFHMHTNVFQFPKDHAMWKTTYVKENNLRSFCGMISAYNFLSDSFKYNRDNDSGYLVGRLFINQDNHFFVEGKRQLGFLYNDFINAEINYEAVRFIIESCILYSLDFDLLTPPYETMQEVSVSDIQELTRNTKLKTAKRLGFKFQADSDIT